MPASMMNYLQDSTLYLVLVYIRIHKETTAYKFFLMIKVSLGEKKYNYILATNIFSINSDHLVKTWASKSYFYEWCLMAKISFANMC